MITSLTALLQSHGEDPFLVTSRERMSYSQAGAQVRKFISQKQDRIEPGARVREQMSDFQHRIPPGTRVALLGRARPEYILTLLGLIEMGAEVALLSLRETAQGVARILADIEARYLIGGEEEREMARAGVEVIPLPGEILSAGPDKEQNYGLSAGEKVERSLVESPGPSSKKNSGLGSGQDPGPGIRQTPGPSSGQSPEQSFNRGYSKKAPPTNGHRPVTILATSGTAGAPQYTVHSLYNHLYSAAGSNQVLPYGPGDTWLLSLPLSHVAGLGILFRAIVGGGAVRFLDSAESLEELVGEVTHLSLVASQLGRLLEKPNLMKDLARMKLVLVGGEPVPGDLRQRCLEAGIPLRVTYGCTEMASQVTVTPPGEDIRRPHNAGVPLPHCRVRLGSGGRIEVAGKTLFLGYLQSGRIQDPRNVEGYFVTGDLGEWWGNNLLVQGRVDNLLISGGENVQPEEIEEIILSRREVSRAVVVPVTHERYGQRPVAVMEMAPEGRLEDLLDYLRECLPGYKIPDRFFRWPEDAPSSAMKVNRGWFQEWVRKPEAETFLLFRRS